MSVLAFCEPLVSYASYTGDAISSCLHEGLRGNHIPKRDAAVNVLSLCSQLEMVLRREIKRDLQRRGQGVTGNIREWPESSTATALLEKIATNVRSINYHTIKKHNHSMYGSSSTNSVGSLNNNINSDKHVSDVSAHFEESQLHNLYPRIYAWIHRETWRESMDEGNLHAHFHRTVELNQIMVLCMQLQGDISNLVNHKYLAHQLALLYQSVSKLGPAMHDARQNIEQHFEQIKTATVTHNEQPVQLEDEHKQWLMEITHTLITRVTSINSNNALAEPLGPTTAYLEMYAQ